jgi:ABC-2 type transport system ATP-binding protein
MTQTPTAESPIVVRSLRKRYGPAEVVRGIDLEVFPGEVFALLGPNGAGKTTTVEILEGIRRRTSGEVSVLGRDPADEARDWRRRIGVVPQSTGAFTDLTVREVVDHFAAFYPTPLPTAEVIDMVGLGKHQNKQTAALSGGQQRRLDVAVGVVGDPDLIFLDEPTTGLDPAARREAWELVRFFAERGTTTLLTTHYLDEAEALAARAGVIVGGEIIEVGPVAELGGRATIPASVGFRWTEALRRLPLPELPADARYGQSDDEHVVLHTASPTALVGELASWAGGAGVRELPELRVYRPTLEEIYLEMIRAHQDRAAAGDAGSPEAASPEAAA